MIRNEPVAPICKITSTTTWLYNKITQYLTEEDKVVARVFNNFQLKLCHWSIHDFYRFYTRPGCNPKFQSGYKNCNVYYYSITESVQILDELIKHQFDSDPIACENFLQRVYDVCERKIPKMNSICVISPPSAGKNYFFDTIINFYLNKGQLGNPNKHNNFAFQECENKRILLWNEPNYESSQTDHIKMVLGGDAYNVRVKQKKDAAVYCTPVIILTNNIVPFMVDPAFKDRVSQFTWKRMPILKDKDKKPNPMAYYYLLEKWGIIETPKEIVYSSSSSDSE